MKCFPGGQEEMWGPWGGDFPSSHEVLFTSVAVNQYVPAKFSLQASVFGVNKQFILFFWKYWKMDLIDTNLILYILWCCTGVMESWEMDGETPDQTTAKSLLFHPNQRNSL